jgi:hypothetical protein
MKTKLLFIALAFGLMSSTCSSEDQPQEENLCECQKVYYDYGVIGMGQGGVVPIWGYTQVGEEQATQMDCDLNTGEYMQIDTNSYYRIECE